MAEPIKPEGVSELPDVAGVIPQCAMWLIIGFAYARPIRCHNPETVAQRLRMEKMPFQSAARHAMAEYQRVARGVTNVGEGKFPAITEGEERFMIESFGSDR
jgi:hypothetical protein